MKKKLSGWIVDAYPSWEGMTVWLIDDESHSHFLSDAFTPSFFVYGARNELHDLCEIIGWWRSALTLRRAERHDLFLHRDLDVLEIAVHNPMRFSKMVQEVKEHKPSLTYYNCTVPVTQLYFYERRLFPLARVEVEVNAHRQICAIELRDSAEDIDYALPEFKTMLIRLEDDECGGNPNHGARPRPLEITCNGTTLILEEDYPKKFLTRLGELLIQYDPDLLLTSYGDSYILPRLFHMAGEHGVTLPFNRDPQQTIRFEAARHYFSYNRMVARPNSFMFFGRVHLDLNNTFLFGDYALDGVLEMARLSQMPIQRVVRRSTGTCLSSMEMSTAYRENVLIPAVKQEAEEFETADRLVLADNGGLVFRPELGLHEVVAEYDALMMFPFIMDKFNISGETPNCSCCPDAIVPELGISICQKRRGLVPATIAPIIAKRRKLKALIRSLPDGARKERYKRLSSCGKWLGVVSFGYTGHRNALFGNITAHQAICAYARDKLLTAKECAERRGFRLLHAMVDALYVQKQNAREEEYDELGQAMSNETGLIFELEGIHNLIAFLPSRQDPQLSVVNRYYGFFRDGEIKMRGIEARRSDTPPFIKNAQMEMLRVLSSAKTRAEFRERAKEVLRLACDYLDSLRSGQVPYHELAISQHLSRDPTEYKTDTLNAIVAKQLLDSGMELEPGESIEYIILDRAADAHIDRVRALEQMEGELSYDVEEYEELFLRSVSTLLAPLGVTQQMLEDHVAQWRALPSLDRTELPMPKQELPLFAWAVNNNSSTARSHTLSVDHAC